MIATAVGMVLFDETDARRHSCRDLFVGARFIGRMGGLLRRNAVIAQRAAPRRKYPWGALLHEPLFSTPSTSRSNAQTPPPFQ